MRGKSRQEFEVVLGNIADKWGGEEFLVEFSKMESFFAVDWQLKV